MPRVTHTQVAGKNSTLTFASSEMRDAKSLAEKEFKVCMP